MDTPAGPAWSEAVENADWIGARLAPSGVTSVVPGGFEAYARILHPAEAPHRGHGRLVRWAEVAAWSGMPLRDDAQFHSVALPPQRPGRRAPWSGQGPPQGTLYLPDAEILAGIVAAWTGTPGHCWFCLWEGYGWGATLLTRAGEPSVRLPDPVPGPVRAGPRVRLPYRDYLLYSGPAGAVVAPSALPGVEQQTANLWWPADRAWCVASEIDLAWTYVGGPAGLIERLLADTRIEALPAGPGDPVARVEDWVTGWVEPAVSSLLAAGEAVIETSRGTVHAWLERRVGRYRGTLRTRSVRDGGEGSSHHPLQHRDKRALRAEVSRSLTEQVIGLVGG